MAYSMILYTFLLLQGCFVISIFNKVIINPKMNFSVSSKSPNSLTDSSFRYSIYPNFLITHDSKIKNKLGFFISSTNYFFEFIGKDKIVSSKEGIFFSIVDLNLLEYKISKMLNWTTILSLKYDVASINEMIFFTSKIIDINDNDLLIYISCILI